jgi:NAD(P)-dependent dehydrogenase (short-subunit alcohol dehydrogenase family)
LVAERAAFVSGGSSGIGYGIAEALLDDGYAVTVTGRRADKLAAATGRLAEHGTVRGVAADFADAEAIEAAVASHAERFGRLDVLVNNAGVGAAEPVAAMTPKTIDLQLQVNLRAYLVCTAAAVELLRASTPAHIVNISSVSGVRGVGGMGAYSASKAGVVGFTQALSEELGPEGIKTSVICPSFVDTPMVGWISDELGSETLIQVSDVVAVVRTLISLSPACNIPQVVLEPPAGGLFAGGGEGDSFAARLRLHADRQAAAG